MLFFKGSGNPGGKAGGGKKKKADDTIQKAKAVQITFTIPEHAWSLKALACALYMILNDKKPDHQTAIGCLKDSDNFGKFFKYRYTVCPIQFLFLIFQLHTYLE